MSESLVQQRKQFRATEVSKLFSWAQGGESVSIIGISGVGKSNLFNHLLDWETQQTYLGETARDYLFVRVNFHYIPDLTSRSLYSIIMEQFELLDTTHPWLGLKDEEVEQLIKYHELLLDAGHDALKVQRYFKLALRVLLRPRQRRLVFVFDQFDDVYKNADERFFANLRGLRESYKYRISYFAFTRSLLTSLVDMDPAREEFSELLSSNVIGLGPYNRPDAQSLLKRIATRTGLPLPSEAIATRLIGLSGGHAGLLKSAFLAVALDGVRLPPDNDAAIKRLLMVSTMEMECGKIWGSIRVDEEKMLARFAHGGTAVSGTRQIQHELQIKGLLIGDEIFCPLFATYVRQQEA